MFCTIAVAGSAVPVLSNPGFESPSAGTATAGTVAGTKSGVVWTTTGVNTGLWKNDPCFGAYNSIGPAAGSQFGNLQEPVRPAALHSLAQNLTGLIPGASYTLTFQATGLNFTSDIARGFSDSGRLGLRRQPVFRVLRWHDAQPWRRHGSEPHVVLDLHDLHDHLHGHIDNPGIEVL